MTPKRRQQLLAFLESLGFGSGSGSGLLPLDPAAADAALATLEEALTHSSTGQPRHHDRLEFLGDAVLRLAAAEFLRSAHPSLSVGDTSALRAQLVSDRWLSDLARAIALEPVLLLGAMAAGDRAGRATVLAECCEALVGAIYTVGGGPQGGLVAVQHWLAPPLAGQRRRAAGRPPAPQLEVGAAGMEPGAGPGPARLQLPRAQPSARGSGALRVPGGGGGPARRGPGRLQAGGGAAGGPGGAGRARAQACSRVLRGTVTSLSQLPPSNSTAAIAPLMRCTKPLQPL